MKKLSLYSILILGCILLFGACEGDRLCSEAQIITSFKVKGTSGSVFNGVFDDNNVIILKVSPYLDAEEELNGAIPTFYLSKGATVTPDPSEPQNFALAEGVKYTVTAEDGKTQNVYTVVCGPSDYLEYGEGFSYAEIRKFKTWVDLGYPGIMEGWNYGVDDSKEYGDLLLYHAYCGDYIVLLSRIYTDFNPASPHCLKVVDKTNLNAAGSLNLGSISLPDLKMITSDYKGRCVAAVVKGGESEFFYWTTPANAPVSVGKIAVNVAASTDGSANFQVVGDITADAWITALAPRSARGEHYRIQVTGGKLASNYSMVQTGYASDDCVGFQMISPLDDTDTPSFVIGDTEGAAGTANSIKCYINSPAGTTTYVMPPYWQGNSSAGTLQAWWVGTGFSTARGGGRAPVVSALPINGKTYVAVTSGTAWWHAATVLNSNLSLTPQENLNIAFGINRNWSYGSWIDWYWDEDLKEAHLAVWFGRLGLYTYKLTCYE